MSKLEWFLLIFVVVCGAVYVGIEQKNSALSRDIPSASSTIALQMATSSIATTTPATTLASSTDPKRVATSTPKNALSGAKISAPPIATPADPNAVSRILNPYNFPPESFDVINEKARASIVNIICSSEGALNPISASGVIIDPKGVVLTNAHVAQYVLLSMSSQIGLSCVARSGSLAASKWDVIPLYIPPIWVEEHVRDITDQHPVGTGEHDYGLLLLTGAASSSFPYLIPDTREGVAFLDDPELLASYPVEFTGAGGGNVYAVTSISTVKKLMTFFQKSIDALSFGSVISAQSGSSGGAVVNAWGRVVGIIVTTSSGNTTGDRDLHAITLSYVSRDLATQSKVNLDTLLSTDVVAAANSFNTLLAPILIKAYISTLAH